MARLPSSGGQSSNEALGCACRVLGLLVLVSFAFLMECVLGVLPVWSGHLSMGDSKQIRPVSGTDIHAKWPETIGYLAQINDSGSMYNGAQYPENYRFFTREQESHKYIGSSLEEEEDLMLQIVQRLNREPASRWLSQFISTRPWNCPLSTQTQWIEAIISATERNQLPLCKEILGLVASLISIESGFHANPLAVDPSGRGSFEDMLQRAENKLYQKYGTLLSLPVVSRLYNDYKQRYYPALAVCRTHWEIELFAKRLAEELKQDAARLPNAVRDVIDKEIDKLSNVIRSKGSMQVKFSTVRQVMKERGEEFTDQELLEYVYTIDGGVDVGVAALKPMFVHYAAWCGQDSDLSWLFFVGMDYNYGFFSSRNMMEQLRVKDLSGLNIAIDGDLLRYDENKKVNIQDSQTFIAAQEALPKVSQDQILNAFLLEKKQDYIYTDIHRLILEAHCERFGETPFAVIGQRTSGERAEIKYGATLTTDTYLRKLDRHLTAIPWDR